MGLGMKSAREWLHARAFEEQHKHGQLFSWIRTTLLESGSKSVGESHDPLDDFGAEYVPIRATCAQVVKPDGDRAIESEYSYSIDPLPYLEWTTQSTHTTSEEFIATATRMVLYLRKKIAQKIFGEEEHGFGISADAAIRLSVLVEEIVELLEKIDQDSACSQYDHILLGVRLSQLDSILGREWYISKPLPAGASARTVRVNKAKERQTVIIGAYQQLRRMGTDLSVASERYRLVSERAKYLASLAGIDTEYGFSPERVRKILSETKKMKAG